MNEKEVYEICMSVDSIIADKLTESIVVGTSYDMLEAHYADQSEKFLPEERDSAKTNATKKRI